MASKLQEYRRMSEEAQRQLTGSLGRFVRRGSKGVALIDTRDDRDRLRYIPKHLLDKPQSQIGFVRFFRVEYRVRDCKLLQRT